MSCLSNLKTTLVLIAGRLARCVAAWWSNVRARCIAAPVSRSFAAKTPENVSPEQLAILRSDPVLSLVSEAPVPPDALPGGWTFWMWAA